MFQYINNNLRTSGAVKISINQKEHTLAEKNQNALTEKDTSIILVHAPVSYILLNLISFIPYLSHTSKNR